MRKLRILVINECDEEKLAEVKAEMLKRGAPKVKAVWVECQNLWFALDGSHRIRAAKELGITPEIDEIGYEDKRSFEALGLDCDMDIDTVAELVDFMDRTITRSYHLMFDFQEY